MKTRMQEKTLVVPLIQNTLHVPSSPLATNPPTKIPSSSSTANLVNPALLNAPTFASRPSIAQKFRPDGTQFRPITPLEAIYYHERLDLITHPLIKGLIKWKWDNFAAKRFYILLALEVLFLISWTCIALLTPFPIRYMYRFPQDIWRCVLWAISIGFLVWQIVQEMIDISYTRQRFEDYMIWESERTKHQLDLISKNRYKSNLVGTSAQAGAKKVESVAKLNSNTGEIEHITITETTSSANPVISNTRSHHSQHHPLPTSVPTIVKGKATEPQPLQQTPIDVIVSTADVSTDPTNAKKKNRPGTVPEIPYIPSPLPRRRSRIGLFVERFRERARRRLKSYYMYYSLNNLFDWIIYILCIFTMVTHGIDISSHTVIRARIHMYTASITVICMWFRFMVFFRTITISAKTLRSKLVEIKLGELVIMVSVREREREKKNGHSLQRLRATAQASSERSKSHTAFQRQHNQASTNDRAGLKTPRPRTDNKFQQITLKLSNNGS